MELRLSKLRPSVALLEFNKQLKCETLLDKFEQQQPETAHVFFHRKQNSVPEFCPLIILSIYGPMVLWSNPSSRVQGLQWAQSTSFCQEMIQEMLASASSGQTTRLGICCFRTLALISYHVLLSYYILSRYFSQARVVKVKVA